MTVAGQSHVSLRAAAWFCFRICSKPRSVQGQPVCRAIMPFSSWRSKARAPWESLAPGHVGPHQGGPCAYGQGLVPGVLEGGKSGLDVGAEV